MLYPPRLSHAFLSLMALLLATACGDGESSKDTNDGTGGNPSTCKVDDKACGGGYECDDSGDEVECVDIDECAEGTDDCDDDSHCVNNEGSFSCQPCAAGYEFDGSQCVDIDECDEGTDSCDEHARCENSDGAYECTCDDGFESDGEECADIDECMEGTDDCDDDSHCVNNEGSFSCQPCAAGYELDGDACVDIDECAVDNGGCGDLTAGACENSEGGFACLCSDGYLLVEDTCVYTVPTVVTSTPLQGAADVYPSEFFIEPGYGSGPSGFGIRERVYVRLTFDMQMNTDEVTVVVTDEAGLEEPRIFEGVWDETGHTLTAVILPHEFDQSSPAMYDETTYNVSFEALESTYGTPVDPDDDAYPGAQLTFTTGVRILVLNHACGHVINGPYASATAIATPEFWAPNTDTPHNHYTISLPEGDLGEYVGYTSYFPNQTAKYHFFAQTAGNVQLEVAPIDLDTFELGPWTEIEVEVASPACHAIRPIVLDQVTGAPSLGPPKTGITHQYTLNLSDEELYLLRWTSPDDTVQMIVENAGSN